MSAKKEELLLESGLPPKRASWEKKVEAAWKILRAAHPETEKWTRFAVGTDELSYVQVLPFTSTTTPSRHFTRGTRSYTPIEFPMCCGIGYINSWGAGPLNYFPQRRVIPLLQQAAFILWMDTMKRFCLYGLIITSVVETTFPAVPQLLKYAGWKKGGGGINHVHDHRECAIWCFVVHDKKKELEKWV